MNKSIIKRRIGIAFLASITLGLTPYSPEPHLFGKIRWVLGGAEGMKLIDYWDLIMHGAPWLLLIFFIIQYITTKDNKMDLQEILKKPSTKIIDVREVSEYESGHAENAINVPLSQFGSQVNDLKNMDGDLLLYCRSGNRSGQATTILKNSGVSNAYNVGSLDDMISLQGLVNA